jgi:hypothetical protein
MTDQASFESSVVARILRRAGDIEHDRDAENDPRIIAEASLIAAAEEVGMSVDAVRHSIAVERLGPLPETRRGDRLVGPARVHVDAELPAKANEALARVDSWLVDGHHLRRDVLQSGHGEWSKRSGVVGVTVRTIRGATGEGKLGDSQRIDATARETGSGSSVVRVTVDRTTNRRIAGGGASVAAAGGVAGVVLAVVAAPPIALVALPISMLVGAAMTSAGRRQARETEREIQRMLNAVTAGAGPTRLSVDVVRRVTGRATAAGSKALLAPQRDDAALARSRVRRA